MQKRGDEKRARILSIISLNTAQGNVAMTVREIAHDLGASVATVHRHIRVLADAGQITYTPGQSRTIRAVPGSSNGRTAGSGPAD